MATQIIEHQNCLKKDKTYGAKANPMKEEGKYRCARCGEVFQIAKTAPSPIKVEKPENKSFDSARSKKEKTINKFLSKIRKDN